MSSIDNVRDLLTNIRQQSNTHFMASCPVHGDNTPSLSVTWIQDPDCGGLTLLKCHGCGASAAEITAALGHTMALLYDEPIPEDRRRRGAARVGRSPQQRRAGKRRNSGKLPPMIVKLPETPELTHNYVETRRYPYTNPDTGALVQEVIRYECETCTTPDGREIHERHKDFRQEYITADGRRLKRKPDGFVPVLFRQREVLDAIAAGTPVWLLEGEKDVENAYAAGDIATTNAQGGLNFPPERVDVFQGGTVLVVLDRDAAGYGRGTELAKLFTDNSIEFKLLLPETTAAKSDYTDHLEAGLRDTTRPYNGFVPVVPSELTAHDIVAKLRRVLDGALVTTVEHARKQASAYAARAHAEGTDNPELELQRAQAWARETERRFESFADQVAEIRKLARLACTPWANQAVEQAVDIWGEAKAKARKAFEDAQLAVPEPLLDDEEIVPEHDTEPAPESEPAAAPTASRPTPADPVGADDVEEDPGRGLVISAPRYRILHGRLVEVITTEGVERAKQVLSLDARVVEMEYLETEAETETDRPELFGREYLEAFTKVNPPAPDKLTSVVVGYHHPDNGEWTLQRIAADDYRDCTWLESLPGPPDYDSRPSALAKLRDALKAAGGTDIKQTVCYRSTGWRREVASGEWVFVHAGGVIDAKGARVAPVMLGGPLARFELPAPAAEAADLRDAFFDHSGDMLTQLPARIAAPLIGHMFRAALGANPWVLLLVGSPGSYKTSVASLGMHHWGELWDRRHPATSMSGNGDTFNALRIKLHASKDVVFWADDVAPTRDFTAAQKSLEEFGRLVHNGEQRSRATRDGQGVLDGTPPRASAIITSEVTPRAGSSGGERLFPVPMRASELEIQTLIHLDRSESRYGRALVMSSFLRWLASNLDKARVLAREQAEEFAESLRRGGTDVRRSQAVGELWAGWAVLGRFLIESGALSEDESNNVQSLAMVGLVDAVGAATDPDIPATMGARVRDLVAHALRTGICFVDDVRTGQRPEFPLASRLGWRRTPMGDTSFREDAKGIKLGYVLADPGAREGEPQLLVWREALEQVLKEAAGRMTDAPQVDIGTALRALAELGVLITEPRPGGVRHSVQRRLHCEGRRERMVALRLEALLGGEPDPGDDQPWLSGPEPEPDSPLDGLTLREILGAGCRTSDVASEPAETSEPEPEEGSEGLDDSEPTDTTQEPTIPAHDDPEESDDMVKHPPCEGQFELAFTTEPDTATTGSLHEPAVEEAVDTDTDAVPPPAVADAATASAPTAASPERTAVASAVAVTPSRSGAYIAPCVVADVDGLWLPDGTSRPLPTPLRHAGHLAMLVPQLGIGHEVNDKWSEAGQVWVTAALLAQLGVTPPEQTPDSHQIRKDIQAATAGSALVEEARADGWLFGAPGDRLGGWTRVWREDVPPVLIVLEAGLAHGDERDPLLGDNPAPATLARRLGLFADALNWPYRMTAQITGFDLLRHTRRDRDTVLKGFDPVAPERISALEEDLQWNRTPDAAELRMRFVHSYDRGGSHLGGTASLDLGYGPARHYPEGLAFDARLPGYWRVEVPASGDRRYPNPLLPGGTTKPGLLWVTTPTMALAKECGYEPTVEEAYVWEQKTRVMDSWYHRMRDARAALDVDDPDAQLARDLVKAVYTRTLGQTGSEQFMRRTKKMKVIKDDGTTEEQLVESWADGFAPHRRHHVVAKARANILRFVRKTGTATGMWPVAIDNDTLLYISDDPNPETAFPGDRTSSRDTWGRGIGQYKWEGSALLSDQLKYLEHGTYMNSLGYSGKEALTEEWDIEQMGQVPHQ